MDSKLLLVNAITLLYWESQIYVAGDNSAELVRSVIESIKLPESTMDGDRSREVLAGLRATALWMANNPPHYDYDKNLLLQRIRVNTGYDTALYAAFEDGVRDLNTEEEIKRVCLEYRELLNNYLQRNKIKDILKKATHKALFQEDSIDWRTFVQETIGELEPFAAGSGGPDGNGAVDDVNFSDVEKLAAMLERAAEESNSQGTLKTGWQAINRMTGDHNGFRRGEFIVVGALQHNFKTGFTLNLFKHMALYNKPYMRDPKKKPLLIHLSLENELTTNLLWLYANLKENETREPCDITFINRSEAAAYVKQRLEANGYHIYMCRKNPTDFGYYDLVNMVEYFESEGYEIHAIVCDYLNMMSKKGCSTGGPTGSEVRDLFRRTRNLCAPKGITFITPHQLSTEAKALVRQGIENFVQEIANKGYYDSCRTIDQEVDLEIYIHIEKHMGESYLTVQRGKHRKVSITNEKDLYTVLKFEKVGGILDDINGKDLSLRKVGLAKGEEGSDNAWWAPETMASDIPQ